MADSVGGTPLEAAARALYEWEFADEGMVQWENLHPSARKSWEKPAVAALTAAIDAIPDEELSVWFGDNYMLDRDTVRRALGLEGDQG